MTETVTVEQQIRFCEERIAQIKCILCFATEDEAADLAEEHEELRQRLFDLRDSLRDDDS